MISLISRVWVKSISIFCTYFLPLNESSKEKVLLQHLLEQSIPSGELKDEIEKGIVQKNTGAALNYGDHIPLISDYVEQEIIRLKDDQNQHENNPAPVDLLDDLFRQAWKKVWGNSV